MSEGVQQALFDEGIALPPPPLGGVGGGFAFRPHYHTTEVMKKRGMGSAQVARLTAKLLEMLDQPLPETLPQWLILPRPTHCAGHRPA